MKKKPAEVDFKSKVAAPEAPAVPALDEAKQVIVQVIQQFIADEKGNTVTGNNMAGLLMQINGALDGNITIKQQEGNTP